MTGHQGTPSTWQRSAWRNRIQSILLILFLLGLVALLGELLFGESGRWLALAAGLIAVLSAPGSRGRLTLAAYRARVLPPQLAPDLWALLQRLAERAELPRTPRLYVVPSHTINAFAVGSRNEPSVAVTEGLLRSLTPREITGVLAHEMSHIAHGDPVRDDPGRCRQPPHQPAVAGGPAVADSGAAPDAADAGGYPLDRSDSIGGGSAAGVAGATGPIAGPGVRRRSGRRPADRRPRRTGLGPGQNRAGQPVLARLAAARLG